jgi:thioredoxin-related protein
MRCFSLGLVLACSLIGLANAHGDDLSFSMFADAPAVADDAPLTFSMFEADPFEEVRGDLEFALFVEETAEAKATREKQMLVFKSKHCGQPCIDLEKKTLAKLKELGWWVGTDESAAIRVVEVESHQDLGLRFGIDAAPTFVMLERGKEVDRRVGLIDHLQLIKIYRGEGRHSVAYR